MVTSTAIPARGKVISVDGPTVVFNPANTNYQCKLATATPYGGPLSTLVDVTIRATARKLWTVASGGNFISPIFGPPRIVQGRIKSLDQTTMVVHAGTPVLVTLPTDDAAVDLAAGPLAVGALVNVALMPGASLSVE